MKIWRWALAEETFPDTVNPAGVLRRVKQALAYVSKAAGYQVKFEQVDIEDEPDLVFGFEDFGPEDPSIGSWEKHGRRYSVAFNSRYHWKTRWWDVRNSQSLYAIAIHQVVHVLGLYRRNYPGEEHYHNPDPGSVMHSNPKYPHLTDNDRVLLLHVTRGR